MSRSAAKKCYEAAGLKPSDVDVVELHDCFSANELITYEALGLCPEGETAALKTLRYPPAILKHSCRNGYNFHFPSSTGI